MREDKVVMPERLTAENGAKGLLVGKFFETIILDNPDYCECGECELCADISGETPDIEYKVPVSWTTIKEIYKLAVEHLGVSVNAKA